MTCPRLVAAFAAVVLFVAGVDVSTEVWLNKLPLLFYSVDLVSSPSPLPSPLPSRDPLATASPSTPPLSTNKSKQPVRLQIRGRLNTYPP
jgi:hypothetical protein